MKTLQNLNFKTLCALYTFGFLMLVFQYVFIFAPAVSAQSISGYTATMIGGSTNGVSGLCCNGVVLDFDSINPLNIFILEGEVLFDPILSTSYLSGNEFSSNYNTLGTIMPWACLTIASECYTPEYMPRIRTIGTSSGQSLI